MRRLQLLRRNLVPPQLLNKFLEDSESARPFPRWPAIPVPVAVAAAKRHRIHTRAVSTANPFQTVWVSQLPSSCTHTCMLLLTPTATTTLCPHPSTAEGSPTHLHGARRTGHQRPAELLCSCCISTLHCIACSKHAARLHAG